MPMTKKLGAPSPQVNPLIWGALLASVLASQAAIGQSFSEDAERAQRLGTAATQCALLASASREQLHPEAGRLARLGAENIVIAASEWISLASTFEGNELGPLREFIQSQSVDFWIGSAFATATQHVNDFLDDKHPWGSGASYEMTRLSREVAAELEFEARNCRFL